MTKIDEVLAMLKEQASIWAGVDEMGYRAAMGALNKAEEIVGLPTTEDVDEPDRE